MGFIVWIIAIKLYFRIYDFITGEDSFTLLDMLPTFLYKIVHMTVCFLFVVVNIKFWIFIKSNIVLSILGILFPICEGALTLILLICSLEAIAHLCD